jgi:hypothetical protein
VSEPSPQRVSPSRVTVDNVLDTFLAETDIPIWYVDKTIEMPDGSTHKWVHIIPKEAAESRAAELDLGPDDMDTILDVLLVDEYAPEDLGILAASAPNASTARALVTAAAARAKLRVRMSTRTPATAAMRAHRPNAAQIATKRDHANALREFHAANPRRNIL